MAENFPFQLVPWPDKTFTVTPSDSVNLSTQIDALEIGTAGDVSIITPNGETLDLTAVPAGILPLAATRVRSTGTTATGLVGHVRDDSPGRLWRKFDLARLPEWSTYGFTPEDSQSFERSTDGNWRTLKGIGELLPSDWRTTAWTLLYVDPINGNDQTANDGSSWKLAKKSLNSALQLSQTQKLVIVPDGAVFSYDLSSGLPWSLDSEAAPVGSVIIMPISVYRKNGVGNEVWTCNTEVPVSGTWTSVSGKLGVFKVTVADDAKRPRLVASLTSQIPSGVIFDYSHLDEYGQPLRYQRVEQGQIETTRYSYCLGDTDQELWVNVGSNQLSATEKLRLFLCSQANAVVNFGAKQFHIVNGIFEGGRVGYKVGGTGVDNVTCKIRLYNCRVTLSAGDSQGFFVNGSPSGSGKIDVGLYDCMFDGNGFDGVSYYGNTQFIESGCIAYANGYVRDCVSSGFWGKSNGFTTHYKTVGVRVGCIAYGNGGANYGDSAFLGQIAVANLGCFSFNSNGDPAKSHYQTDFALIADPPGSGYNGTARLWLLDPKFSTKDGESSTSRYYLNLDKNNTVDNNPIIWFNGDWPARVRLSGAATTADVTRVEFPT